MVGVYCLLLVFLSYTMVAYSPQTDNKEGTSQNQISTIHGKNNPAESLKVRVHRRCWWCVEHVDLDLKPKSWNCSASESAWSQCSGKGRHPSGSMRVFSLQLQLPICTINWFYLRLGNHWYQRSLNVISFSQYSAFLYHLASNLCYFFSAYRLLKREEYSPRLSSWWIVSICQ